MQSDLQTQILAEVAQRCLDPLEMLLGPGEETTILRSRLEANARMWAAQLLQDEDEKLSAQTAVDLMVTLWPGDQQPPAEWWRTPLGHAIARSAGHPSAQAVSYSVAAAMLGVNRSRVGQLADTGKLDRHPDGGVTTVSVRSRLRSAR